MSFHLGGSDLDLRWRTVISDALGQVLVLIQWTRVQKTWRTEVLVLFGDREEAGPETRIHVQKCAGVPGQGARETGKGRSQFLSRFPLWMEL